MAKNLRGAALRFASFVRYGARSEPRTSDASLFSITITTTWEVRDAGRRRGDGRDALSWVAAEPHAVVPSTAASATASAESRVRTRTVKQPPPERGCTPADARHLHSRPE